MGSSIKTVTVYENKENTERNAINTYPKLKQLNNIQSLKKQRPNVNISDVIISFMKTEYLHFDSNTQHNQKTTMHILNKVQFV